MEDYRHGDDKEMEKEEEGERWNAGGPDIWSGEARWRGEMRERNQKRTQVSNHLPMSRVKKVQPKLFIKETRPTLMKRIVCFPPHLIHSE